VQNYKNNTALTLAWLIPLSFPCSSSRVLVLEYLHVLWQSLTFGSLAVKVSSSSRHLCSNDVLLRSVAVGLYYNARSLSLTFQIGAVPVATGCCCPTQRCGPWISGPNSSSGGGSSSSSSLLMQLRENSLNLAVKVNHGVIYIIQANCRQISALLRHHAASSQFLIGRMLHNVYIISLSLP
jgi:hypothetical protein